MDKYKARRKVKEWNEKYDVGQKVRIHPKDGDPIVTKTQSEAYMLNLDAYVDTKEPKNVAYSIGQVEPIEEDSTNIKTKKRNKMTKYTRQGNISFMQPYKDPCKLRNVTKGNYFVYDGELYRKYDDTRKANVYKVKDNQITTLSENDEVKRAKVRIEVKEEK